MEQQGHILGSGLNEFDGLNDGVTDSTSGVTTYTTVIGSSNGDNVGITETHYTYRPPDYLSTNLGINTAPLNLFYNNGKYWLADRYVWGEKTISYFGVRTMSAQILDGRNLFSSDGTVSEWSSWEGSFGVRPVVLLGSGVTLTKDTTNSTATTTYWNIEF